MIAKELTTITKPITAAIILLRAASVLLFSPPEVIHWRAPITKKAKTRTAAAINTTRRDKLMRSLMFPIKPTGGVTRPVKALFVAEVVLEVAVVVAEDVLFGCTSVVKYIVPFWPLFTLTC